MKQQKGKQTNETDWKLDGAFPKFGGAIILRLPWYVVQYIMQEKKRIVVHDVKRRSRRKTEIFENEGKHLRPARRASEKLVAPQVMAEENLRNNVQYAYISWCDSCP